MKTFDERKKSVEQYMTNILKKRRKTLIGLTSLVLVVSVLALVLFLPYDTTPPDVSMYADNEYYVLIQRLNELNYDPPVVKNNFEYLRMLSKFFRTGFRKGEGVLMDELNSSVMPGAPQAKPDEELQFGATGGAPEDAYVEVTDNQVESVIEADIIKRSREYIFYLRGKILSVYSIAGSESQLVGSFTVDSQMADDPAQSKMQDYGETIVYDLDYYTNQEMFLSTDCKTVTILLQGYSKTMGACTILVGLDVMDPANITQKQQVCFTGSYLSSRMADGQILLTYNYSFNASSVDYENPATFVPQYGTPGNMTCIPGKDVVCPDNISTTRYTVICKVDGESLEVTGATALLSYSQQLYVSEDTIYATNSYTHRNQESFDNQYRQTSMTEITGVSYSGDSLEVLGTIAVEGSLKDQYSMDQYKGVLRVVTSTSVSYFEEIVYDEYASSTISASQRNVNLYCIDLKNWEIAAEVIAFAPDGEDAQSVRFDGIHAYVCTAEVITLTDPVYFFDLSDLDHITWSDTGTIDGYSTSLIQLGDGYLLGVGYGESRNLKIEIYQQYDGKVVSVCAYERSAAFSTEYKSYLVDRENDLIGLSIYDYNTAKWEYVLLHFDGYQLNQIAALNPQLIHMDNTRAFLADGWLYVLTDGTTDMLTQQVW